MSHYQLASSWLIVLLSTGCVYPTERSSDLSVEMDSIPALRQGTFDTLTARVVTSTGIVVPDAPIQFQSSNSAAVVVQPDGELQATGFGISLVTARAIGFENAAAAEQLVTVKKPVDVDSIRPLSVQYGERVKFFGVGLNPDSIFLVSLGGVPVPEHFAWNPVDPDRPNGFGTLDVWVAPPTPQEAAVVIIAPDRAFGADTLRVIRTDILEPNDLTPRNLGSLPDGFFNPALAFEQRLREDLGVDWYQIEQTTAADRSIVVRSNQTTNETFRFILAQRGVFGRDPAGNFVIANDGWATGGPGLQVCKGVGFEFSYLPGQQVVVAFGDLPAGTYDIIAPYGAPGGYQLRIVNAYVSERPVDLDEENDICGSAKLLTPGETKELTIDVPYDPDWFSYTATTTVSAVFSTTVTGRGTFLDPDLEMFLFRDDDSTIVPVGESSPGSDTATDVVSATLQEGTRYLLLVTDYAGVSTRYELTMTTTQPGVGVAEQSMTKIGERVRLLPRQAAVRR